MATARSVISVGLTGYLAVSYYPSAGRVGLDVVGPPVRSLSWTRSGIVQTDEQTDIHEIDRQTHIAASATSNATINTKA